MLRNFLYLDTEKLASYVTALENGAVTESTKRLMKSRSGKAGADVKLAAASGELGHEEEEATTRSDTDGARFDRLLRAARDNPDDLAWIDIINPDDDLVDVGIGAMVSWECEVYVPDAIRVMAKSGEALGALNMLSSILPAAGQLNLGTTGLPANSEIQAMSSFISNVNIATVVVGENDETEWKVAGRLKDDFIIGEMEGRAQVIGKISEKIQPGRWKPFLTFPGMSLVGREERRRLERQAPASTDQDKYLSGPALMLDVLAIFR